MHELRSGGEPELHVQLQLLAPCDLIIVEGYKSEAIEKIEVHRSASGKPLLHLDDPLVVAIATDEKLDTALPQFNLDSPDAVASYIVRHFGLRKTSIHVVK